MKGKATVFLVLLLFLFIPCLCFAQQYPDSPASETSISSVESSLLDERLINYWFQRKVYIRQGDLDFAKQETDNIIDFLREKKIKSIPSLSASFTAEGVEYLENGNIELAIESFQAATEIDPYSSAAYYNLADAYFRQSKGNIFNYFIISFKGLIAPFRHYNLFNIPRAQLLKLLFIALSLSIATFILISFIKYQALIRHDLSEILTAKINPFWATILPWFIILVPFLVTLGVYWILIYWLMFSWIYFQKKEKVLYSFFLIFLFLSFPLLIFSNTLLDATKSPTISVIYTSLANVHDLEALDDLKRLTNQNPTDPDIRFLLASQQQKAGNFEEAFEQYNQILRINSGFHMAHNNKANIYFSLGEYRLASENYKRAIAAQSRQAIYHYNLSLTYSEMLQFESANESMRLAEQIDNSLISRLRRQPKAIVIDAVPERASLKGKIRQEFMQLLGESASQYSLFNLSPVLSLFINPLAIASFVVIIIIVVISYYWKDRRIAQLCDRCGKAFCFRCRIGFSPSKSCSQCEHIFIKQDGLLPEVKRSKISEIKNYQLKKNIQKWLFSLILPGTGHHLENRSISGFILNFLWVFGLIIFLSDNNLIRHQIYTSTGTFTFPQVIALIELGMIYLITLITIRK